MPTGGGGGGGGFTTWFGCGTNAGSYQLTSGNTIALTGFSLQGTVQFSNMSINVATAAASGTWDVGIYSAAGALLANTGPQSYTTTGFFTTAVLQAPVTLHPGKYLFAFTGPTTTLLLEADAVTPSWYFNRGYGSSSSNTLPATITAPTPAANLSMFMFQLS